MMNVSMVKELQDEVNLDMSEQKPYVELDSFTSP